MPPGGTWALSQGGRSELSPDSVMSRMGRGWLLLSLLFALLHLVCAGDSEKLLIKNLLTNYNHLERPVASENDTVPLEFGIL